MNELRAAAFLLISLSSYLYAETVTVATQYPSPLGVYKTMRSLGNTFIAVNGGNVGIGSASALNKLYVVGDVLINAGSSSPGLRVMGNSGSWGPSVGVDNGSQEWRMVSWSDNTLKFVKVTGSTFTPLTISNASAQDSLVIASGGNVGIGTPGPTSKLHVYYPSSATDGLKITRAGMSTALLRVSNDGLTDTLTFNLGGADYVDFKTNGHVNVKSGNLGVGTTSPAQKLHVEGAAYFSGNIGIGDSTPTSGKLQVTATAVDYAIRGESTNNGVAHGVYGHASGIGGDKYAVYGSAMGTGNNNYAIRGYATSGVTNTGLYGLANGAATTNYGVYANANGGTTNYGVYSAGTSYDFYAAGSGTDYGSPSSIRWKKNIKPIENALEKIRNIRGVSFDWDKEHGGQKAIGFIGEEVAQVFPQIVDFDKNSSKPDYYITGMDYSKMTPVLVEAVKQQQDQIVLLRRENEQLKLRLDKLEKRTAAR